MTDLPLSKRLNIAVRQITGHVLPQGFDVSEDAPNTYDDLQAHFAKTGRVLVWSGASDHTIFGDPEVNHMFRAWHDTKHILFELPFTLEGEIEACRLQCEDIKALYGEGETGKALIKLVEAEVIGQALYHDARGGFPKDQRGFISHCIDDPYAAIHAGQYGVC